MLTKKETKPQLLKYIELYEKNGNTRVFAPLAEEYRKSGMIQNALNVLKKELKNHPHYAYGFYSLAACYFDLGKVHLAYETLKPWLTEDNENVAMLHLFADICQALSKKEESLLVLRNLHFLNPKDETVKKKMLTLETELNELQQAKIPALKKSLTESTKLDDQAMINHQMNVSNDSETSDQFEIKNFQTQDHSRPYLSSADLIKINDIEGKINNNDNTESSDEKSTIEYSFILIDYYISKNLHEKSLEVLNSMLLFDQHNASINRKISQVQNLIHKSKFSIVDGNFSDSPLESSEVIDQVVPHFQKEFDKKEKLPEPSKFIERGHKVKSEKLKKRLNAFLDVMKNEALKNIGETPGE